MSPASIRLRRDTRSKRHPSTTHAITLASHLSLTPLHARHSGCRPWSPCFTQPSRVQSSPARTDPVTAWTVHQQEHVNCHTLLPWESPHTFIHLPRGRARLAEPRARRRVPARSDASTPLDGERRSPALHSGWFKEWARHPFARVPGEIGGITWLVSRPASGVPHACPKCSPTPLITFDTIPLHRPAPRWPLPFLASNLAHCLDGAT